MMTRQTAHKWQVIRRSEAVVALKLMVESAQHS